MNFTHLTWQELKEGRRYILLYPPTKQAIEALLITKDEKKVLFYDVDRKYIKKVETAVFICSINAILEDNYSNTS